MGALYLDNAVLINPRLSKNSISVWVRSTTDCPGRKGISVTADIWALIVGEFLARELSFVDTIVDWRSRNGVVKQSIKRAKIPNCIGVDFFTILSGSSNSLKYRKDLISAFLSNYPSPIVWARFDSEKYLLFSLEFH